MIFKTFDELFLNYESHGDQTKPPIVLLHGLGADLNMWRPQIASLPDAGYFLTVPDLRGHGKSDVPASFRITDCARDIKELLEKLNLKRIHLIGVSMGGMIAQEFAVQYPDFAQTLIIVDSLSGISKPIERFNASLAAILLRIFPQRLQVSMIRNSYKKIQHEDVGKYFEDRILHMDSHWLLTARLEVNRFNIFSKISNVKTPTLVLVGDAFGKLAINMARTTADSIPGAQFRILKRGGDPSNLLVPDIFDQAVIDFLEQHPS